MNQITNLRGAVLSAAGIAYQRQKVLPVRYKGIDLRAGYRLDCKEVAVPSKSKVFSKLPGVNSAESNGGGDGPTICAASAPDWYTQTCVR
jgi:hypothetical protein